MTEDQLDERLFGLKLRNKLNQSAGHVDKNITERLFVARQAALAHATQHARGLSLAGFGSLSDIWHDAKAPLALSLLLLSLVMGGDYLQSVQRAAELEEIDSALLTDALPISAYLDRGFDTWLDSEAP